MSISRSVHEFDQKSKSLSYDDIPRIFASLAIYGSMLGFGACLGVLGPSLTEMSDQLNIEVSTTGQVFSWRGIGGLAGTFIAATIAENPMFGVPKHIIVVFAVLFTDLSIFAVPLVSPWGSALAFNLIKGLYFLQGIGLGLIDCMATISVQEMWGQRAQPWMQMKSLSCSLGAVIGPVCVSNFGYSLAFKFTAIVGLSSLIGVMLESLFLLYDKKEKFGDDFVALELENLASNLEAIHEELDYEARSNLGSIDLGSVVSDSEFKEMRKVLSFATPQIVELLDKPMGHIVDVHIVPAHIGLTVAVFSIFHSGLYYTFGGWIAAYTTMIDPAISVSEAAKMASLYSSCMVISGLWGITPSLILSITTVLRIQLSILFLGAVVLFLPMDPAFSNSVSSILMGLAVSCIYPLIMTMANDYDMTMDAKGVSYIILGGGIGEALAPAAIGVLIGLYGPDVFPLAVAVTGLVMICSYIYVHMALTKHKRQMLHPIVGEELTGLLAEEDQTRPRARSRLTRGWRSLSVDKYPGSIALEMIIEGDILAPIEEEPTPGLGTNHKSYQNGQ